MLTPTAISTWTSRYTIRSAPADGRRVVGVP